MREALVPHLILSYQMSYRPIMLMNERQSSLFTIMSPEPGRTTHFTETSNELGDLENLQKLCVAYLFICFFHWTCSACNVQHSTFNCSWLEATACSQLAKSYKLVIHMFIPVLQNSLQLHVFGFKSDFWKRAHCPENLFDSSREQKPQQQLTGKTDLKKASGSLRRTLLLLF